MKVEVSSLSPITQSRLTRSTLALLISVAPTLEVSAQTPDATSEEVEEQQGEEGEINVRNADISAIIRIFSRRIKRNFLLDERVRGKVTMYLPGDVSAEDSLKILDSVLALKGFTAVPVSENLWKVIPSKEARNTTIPTYTGEEEPESPTAAVITRLVTLKHVAADELQPLLQELVSPDGLLTSYQGTNSLLIIDYENNIDRLQKIIRELDVPFTDRELTIVPVSNADAVDIAEKLKDLLGEGQKTEQDQPGVDTRPRNIPGQPPLPPGQAAAVRATAQTAGSSAAAVRSRAPKIIADERTNSIIVLADDESTARVRALVHQLDSKVDLSGNRFYVYRCQHADAEELAQVLGSLSGGVTGGSGTGTAGRQTARGDDDDLFGGSRGSRTRTTGQRGQSRLGAQQRTPGTSRREGREQQGVQSAQIGENVSITADPATNSLIINSDKATYEKIRSLIEKLDIKRRQVLVEAMLLEVSVEDGETLGTDFITSTGGSDGGLMAMNNLGGSQGIQGLLTDPQALSNFSVAAASAGTISLPGLTIPSQAVLLSAAQSNSNVNVLSAPTLLATDNEEAEIVVGQNVPFLASVSTSETNLNNTFNQIDRQDVGITLRITPQISSNDFVTLNIFTDVSAVVPSADTTLGPTTTVRSSETTVITKDSQMIVIGGLMADQTNDSDSGVPFLKDIPVFGHAFRRFTGRRTRTNLLTFITPRIVKDQYDARDATIARRNRLKHEIEHENFFPDRQTILESPAIDRVTETNTDAVDPPGTILPPQGGRSKPSASIERSMTDTRLPHGEPLEIEVAPELPETAPAGARSDAATGQYVVMKVVKRPQGATQLPFNVSPSGMVAIALPPESIGSALRFFEEGKTYRYGAGSEAIVLKPLGIYPSRGDAQRAHKLASATWYELSPYEMMNLGTGLWKRAG